MQMPSATLRIDHRIGFQCCVDQRTMQRTVSEQLHGTPRPIHSKIGTQLRRNVAATAPRCLSGKVLMMSTAVTEPNACDHVLTDR